MANDKELRIGTNFNPAGLKSLKAGIADTIKTLNDFDKTVKSISRSFDQFGNTLNFQLKNFNNFRQGLKDITRSIVDQKRVFQDYSNSVRNLQMTPGLPQLGAGGGGGLVRTGGLVPSGGFGGGGRGGGGGGGERFMGWAQRVGGGGANPPPGGGGGGGGGVILPTPGGGGVYGNNPIYNQSQYLNQLGSGISAAAQMIQNLKTAPYQAVATLQNFRTEIMHSTAAGNYQDLNILRTMFPQLRGDMLGQKAALTNIGGKIISGGGTGGAAMGTGAGMVGGAGASAIGEVLDSTIGANTPEVIEEETFRSGFEINRQMNPMRSMVSEYMQSTAPARLAASRRFGARASFAAMGAGRGHGFDIGESFNALGAIGNQFGAAAAQGIIPNAMRLSEFGLDPGRAGGIQGQLRQAGMLSGLSGDSALAASQSELESIFRRAMSDALQDAPLAENIASAVAGMSMGMGGAGLNAIAAGVGAGAPTPFGIQTRAAGLTGQGPANQFVQQSGLFSGANVATLLHEMPGAPMTLIRALQTAAPSELMGEGSEYLRRLGFQANMRNTVLQARYGPMLQLLGRTEGGGVSDEIRRALDASGGDVTKFIGHAGRNDAAAAISSIMGGGEAGFEQLKGEFAGISGAMRGGRGVAGAMTGRGQDSVARTQVQAQLDVQTRLQAEEAKNVKEIISTLKSGKDVFEFMANHPINFNNFAATMGQLDTFIRLVQDPKTAKGTQALIQVLKSKGSGP